MSHGFGSIAQEASEMSSIAAAIFASICLSGGWGARRRNTPSPFHHQFKPADGLAFRCRHGRRIEWAPERCSHMPGSLSPRSHRDLTWALTMDVSNRMQQGRWPSPNPLCPTRAVPSAVDNRQSVQPCPASLRHVSLDVTPNSIRSRGKLVAVAGFEPASSWL